MDAADKGTIGAVAPDLKRALHVGNTKLGLLVSVVAIVGGIASLPAGALTDRVRRTRLLAGAIVLWGLAQAGSGLVGSYLNLIVARLALGAVVAVAAPAVASLTGDYFAPAVRGRIYGFILFGELVGTGLGLLVAGEITVLSWRAAFFALSLPAFLLAWFVWHLDEPERGRQTTRLGRSGKAASDAAPTLKEKVRATDIEPREETIIEDPGSMSLWDAVRYVIRVRSNIRFIVASALGYFFFAGLRTFALVFLRGHYHLSQSVTTPLLLVLGLGAIAGVVVGGRVGDSLIARGAMAGRVVVAASGYLLAVIVLGPGIFSGILFVSLPLYVVGAFALAVPNPPLDAARLDVIHHALWGRAEAVRSVLRTVGEAGAPLLFGFLADHLLGGGTKGLEYTFLLMLLPLAAAGVLLLRARAPYIQDVASASESERRTDEPEQRRATG